MLAGDNDNAGHEAMLRIRESLLRQGVKSTDTMTYAPLKGSIADLPGKDLMALVGRLITERSSRWQLDFVHSSRVGGRICEAVV